MFTVCPKCTLTLVVTTVDLRAGQGYVRCGRCANVFNALVALREGDPAVGIPNAPNRQPLETSPIPPAEPAHGAGVALDPEPEPVPEPVRETIELTGDEHSLEFDPTDTDVADIFVPPSTEEHDTSSGNYEAVVLGEEPPAEDEAETESEQYADLLPESEPLLVAQSVDHPHAHTLSSGDWSLADDHDDAPDSHESAAAIDLIEDASAEPEQDPQSTEASADSKADPAWVEEMFAEAEAQAVAKRARATDRAAPALTAEPEALVAARVAAPGIAASAIAGPASAAPSSADEDAAEHAEAVIALTTQPKQRPPWQYISGVAALGVLLLLQLVHHNRQSLVLSGGVGAAVSRVYGWFGVTLVPRWDLAAYSVKQLGAEAEGAEGNRLRVRLSLQNESARVQPLPLLRLTLQDRYGNAVATRDLEPRDYLPKRVVDQRLLEPDQRIDAELHVIDPGKAAIGFEIDACLRAESGSIGCANEARRRAAG